MLVALICVLCLAPQPMGVQDAKTAREISYEAFVRLDADAQRAEFVGLSPETKARFKRERAHRWLEANRGSLSARQIAGMERAISFISPRLYASTPSEADREVEAEIRRELECSIGQDRMYEAFTFFPPLEASRGMSALVDEWLFWFENCVV